MKKKGIDKRKYIIRYLALFIFGSVILIISYIKNNINFFLFGLGLMVVSIFLDFLYLMADFEDTSSFADEKKTKKLIKKKPEHKKIRFRFPKLHLPHIRFPRLNLRLPSFKSKKLEKETKLIPKNLKFNIKTSGRITETDFDRLVNIVNQAETVKLSTVAKMFNITEKKAEEWGKILESHELLIMHYPAFGEPELKKWKKENGKNN